MKGAREYSDVFKKAGEQIGRLWIASGNHARGRTLNIYVTPRGFKVTKFNPANGYPYEDNLIKVYGVISGNTEWKEEYGWIIEGKWREDVEKIVRERREFLIRQLKQERESEMERKKRDEQWKEELLRDYQEDV